MVPIMSLLEDLVIATNNVNEATQKAGLHIAAEEYVSGFNNWLHNTLAPSPPIWNTAMFEASALTVVSYFLATQGFYEEATALLREVLEGFLTRLCWDNKNNQSIIHPLKITNGNMTIDYWEWESGKTGRYIGIKRIWAILLENDRINHYQDVYHIREEIENLLSRLNKYVHGRPESRHKSGNSRSSLINARFKQEDFDRWLSHLRSIYRFISTLSVLSYPDLHRMQVYKKFSVLDPEAVIRINIVFEGKSI